MNPEGPVLAIERSAGVGSLALVDRAGATVAAQQWRERPRGGPEPWDALKALLGRVDGGASGLSLLVAGRGPGRYAGLRSALITAAGLSLPSGVPVHARSSGAALALAVLCEEAVDRVAVVGDARRGQCWFGIFNAREGWPEMEGDWSLCEAASLPARIGSGTRVVSPEWTRLAGLPGLVPTGGTAWIEEDRAPDAGALARWALHAQAACLPEEPLAPLYLHPAVDPAPRHAVAARPERKGP